MLGDRMTEEKQLNLKDVEEEILAARRNRAESR